MYQIMTKDGWKNLLPAMQPVPKPEQWWLFHRTIPNGVNQELLDKFNKICNN